MGRFWGDKDGLGHAWFTASWCQQMRLRGEDAQYTHWQHGSCSARSFQSVPNMPRQKSSRKVIKLHFFKSTYAFFPLVVRKHTTSWLLVRALMCLQREGCTWYEETRLKNNSPYSEINNVSAGLWGCDFLAVTAGFKRALQCPAWPAKGNELIPLVLVGVRA